MKINKIFSQIICMITIFALFFLTNAQVWASTLDINNVAAKFPTTEVIQAVNWLLYPSGQQVTVSINSADSKFDIYNNDEKVASFNYTSDYIEYDNRSVVASEDNINENFIVTAGIGGIIESVFDLSGHPNMTLSESGNYTNTYDTYGVQIEKEHYKLSGTDDDGASWSEEGDYLKYFKISLDTDKINALIEKYGVSIDDQDVNEKLLKDFTPKLEATKITENSVALHASVLNYTNTDPSYVIYCYIYRSTSKNGVYEKVSDTAVNCLAGNEVSIIDDNLNSNTTYYYKGKIVGQKLNDIGAQFSEPISVTTKKAVEKKENDDKKTTNKDKDDKKTDDTIKDKDNKVVENPQTGVEIISFAVVGVIMIGCLVVLYYCREKSLFKKM